MKITIYKEVQDKRGQARPMPVYVLEVKNAKKASKITRKLEKLTGILHFWED